MDKIENDISLKREYKHDLLKYLIYVFSNTESSIELHQEIGRYLGVNEDELKKIYHTTKGDLVRSKSEVIIANLLFDSGLEYHYERELIYDKGKIRPDFTVVTPSGNTYYWEHLGMLGIEEYDNIWLLKKEIYDSQFKGKLKVTYEGPSLNSSALKLIDELKLL